jgi:hypothetical protein
MTPPSASSRSRASLIELDRFSTVDLKHWRQVSADLDELNNLLYFGIEPQRRRRKSDMIAALQSVAPLQVSIDRWVRNVDFRFSYSPLSAAGSLTGFGGRFNIGMDVEQSMHNPWPALYLAEDLETAFREKFQLGRGDRVEGLTPQELALVPHDDFATIHVNGYLERVFDIDQPDCLKALCAVLYKMKLPATARVIQRRLGIPDRAIYMVRTPTRLREEVFEKNWRVSPAQFGLPAVSHLLAGLILDAGFEAILYPSTKGGGRCLAIFPHSLASDRSHVQLANEAPSGVTLARLDLDTADELCGWELLRPHQRPEVI